MPQDKKPPSQIGQAYEYVRDPSKIGNRPKYKAATTTAVEEKPARPAPISPGTKQWIAQGNKKGRRYKAAVQQKIGPSTRQPMEPIEEIAPVKKTPKMSNVY